MEARAASVAKWTGFYDAGFSPWDAHRPASQLVAFLQEHPEGKQLTNQRVPEVLEMGCGTGASCVWMAERGMAVVGVDLAPQPLITASAAATAAGVADRCRFLAADFVTLPVPFSFASALQLSDQQEATPRAAESAEVIEQGEGGFDLVYDCQCFHVLRKEIGERPVVDKISRLVRKGGIFFTLVGNCDEEIIGPERLTKDELVNAFAATFELVSVFETRFDMTEDYKTLPRPPLAWCGIFKRK